MADSGYGSEENYKFMIDNGIVPYVKFNMFHAEQKRKHRDNPFLPQNLHYNKEGNYYVCPMGQHMDFVREEKRYPHSGGANSKKCAEPLTSAKNRFIIVVRSS